MRVPTTSKVKEVNLLKFGLSYYSPLTHCSTERVKRDSDDALVSYYFFDVLFER